MPNKITHLHTPDDSRRYSCSDVLREALQDVESGGRTPTKCVVLFLDDGAHQRYNTGWVQSGMRMSEMIALMEVIKQRIINEEMQGGK